MLVFLLRSQPRTTCSVLRKTSGCGTWKIWLGNSSGEESLLAGSCFNPSIFSRRKKWSKRPSSSDIACLSVGDGMGWPAHTFETDKGIFWHPLDLRKKGWTWKGQKSSVIRSVLIGEFRGRKTLNFNPVWGGGRKEKRGINWGKGGVETWTRACPNLSWTRAKTEDSFSRGMQSHYDTQHWGWGKRPGSSFPDLRRIEKTLPVLFFFSFFLKKSFAFARKISSKKRWWEGFFSKRRLFFLLLFFFSHENCSKILLLLHPISRLFNILSLSQKHERISRFPSFGAVCLCWRVFSLEAIIIVGSLLSALRHKTPPSEFFSFFLFSFLFKSALLLSRANTLQVKKADDDDSQSRTKKKKRKKDVFARRRKKIRESSFGLT